MLNTYDRDGRLKISTQNVGDRLEITLIARDDTNAYKVVVIDPVTGKFIVADHTDLDHADNIVGIILQSVLADGGSAVVTSGIVQNHTWSWSVQSPIFLSTNGDMTQTPPGSGFVVRIGTPLQATVMVVDIGPSIILI